MGLGCDGASVNMAARGLRGHLESSMAWIFVFWCLSHRLELALKDALKDTMLATIDTMMMTRLYYLYKNSPKKCRELQEIAQALKETYDEDLAGLDTGNAAAGGTRPLRACGNRFIAHKVAALERLVDRYGTYLNHLVILVEDPSRSVKSADRQKLKGYLLQWRDAKMLLGCGVFLDLLKPAALLCKVLQNDDLCIVGAIEAIIKTSNSIEKLQKLSYTDLPTVKRILCTMQQDDGSISYQGALITNYERARTFFASHTEQFARAIIHCMRQRLTLQSPHLLSNAFMILAPKGWEKAQEPSFAFDAIDNLSDKFRVPLEKSGIDCTHLHEEWEDIVEYSKRYLNLTSEDYRSLWWKLFNTKDSKKWMNILGLVELLFCLPMANGRVERVFSQLKGIKSEKRHRLGKDRLEALVRISVEGSHPSVWDATGAVQLWWYSKVRRQGHEALINLKLAERQKTLVIMKLDFSQ